MSPIQQKRVSTMIFNFCWVLISLALASTDALLTNPFNAGKKIVLANK
jgi:hypothetical protein